MPDFVSLSCPNCGGKLEIKPSVQRFACGYCGIEHIIERNGGIVTLEPVVDELKRVTEGVDRTASELAITRLETEIFALYQKRDSIIGKPAGNSLLGLVLLVMFIFTGVSLAYGGLGDAVIPGLLTVVVTILFIYDYNLKQKVLQREAEPINKLIREKEEELKKHRSIVEIK